MKRLLPYLLLGFLMISGGRSMLSAQTTTCNFNTPNLIVTFWDSCTNTNHSINGYAVFSSCYKYQWKVNGNVVSNSRQLNYQVQQNGTYNVCLSIIDSCRNCDTTICSVRQFTCIPQAPCQWNTVNQLVTFKDSCTSAGKIINGTAAYNSCFKYLWKVNNVVVSTDRILSHTVTQNGTYNVCLSISDSCRRCDTTICMARTFNCNSSTAPCHWAPASQVVHFWDSCSNTNRSINGYAVFNSCYKYLWKINGNIVSTSRILNYPVTQNGTYNVCLSIIDSCRNCDTTICSIRQFTCIPPPVCTWPAQISEMTFNDTCTNAKRVINARAYYGGTCYKYVWKVNGVVVGNNTHILSYPVTQNGTYNVCVTITDLCRGCDTTICRARTFNCTPTSVPCQWAPATQYVTFWDSCTNSGKSLNGYAYFNPCYKYLWKVNGVVVSTSRQLHYPVNANGTYVVCLTISDTCRRCDTTFCSTRVINCTPVPSVCRWTPASQYVHFWDSCTNAGKWLNGNAAYNPCFKYQWKVNGNIVSTEYALRYPVLQNGTYSVCLSIIDTCRRCDTTICSTRVINCTTPTGCHWSPQTSQYVLFSDSCKNSGNSLNGYAIYNPCYKYKWKVNGVVVSTNRILNYPVNLNGTYVVCLTISDTCRRCDTTFCSTRVLNCLPTNSCWSGRNIYPYFWDTCTATKKSLNGYVSPNSTGFGCFKYTWKVNGNIAGTGPRLNYPVNANGTYVVCVTVRDTCRGCDTTICSIRQLHCTPTIAICNWTNQNPTVRFWDSCANNRVSLNGIAAFNSSTAHCIRYQWQVNNQPAGTGNTLHYPVTQNGTYKVCVFVSDSCRRCDTSFCSIRQITCVDELISTEQESQLRIFENPTSGLINVDWTGENSFFTLSSTSGQVIQSGNLYYGTQLLDLGGHPTGMYILKVHAGDAILTRKISLQKQ